MIAAAARLIGRWYSIPLLLLVWQVVVGSGLVQSRLLPSPVQVGEVLLAELGNGELAYHAAVTVARALAGFALAAIVGIPFAAAMARSAVWRNLFEPIFLLGYPVPKIALYPVFTYVFGLGAAPKIAFAFLECLYPIVLTCFLGFRAIETRLIWTAQNFGASRTVIMRRVILPAALPSVFAAFRIALPVAIVVVVLTEMIGDSIGLGYYITIWSTRFSFSNVYAAIVTIGVCGFALDQALLLARRRVVYWQREAG